MQDEIRPVRPAVSNANDAEFQPAPDLTRAPPAEPLSPAVAAQIEAQLRGIDSVQVRVLGDDPSPGRDVAAHLVAKGYKVDISMAERMMPPPLHRHVFRFQGRRAILTIAPDLP